MDAEAKSLTVVTILMAAIKVRGEMGEDIDIKISDAQTSTVDVPEVLSATRIRILAIASRSYVGLVSSRYQASSHQELFTRIRGSSSTGGRKGHRHIACERHLARLITLSWYLLEGTKRLP